MNRRQRTSRNRPQHPRPTPQRLDPLGTLAARRAAVIFSIVALADAVVSIAQHGNEIRVPPAAGLALVALLFACGIIVRASAVSHAPVTRLAHVSTVGLALVAYTLSAVSTWGSNPMIEDDWGQYALALLIATVAMTRPPIDIAVVGALAAVAVGVMAALQSSFLMVPTSAAIYAIAAMTPIVAMCFAATAYSLDMVRHIRRWQRSVRAAMLRLEPGVREVAARALRQGEVTLLNQGAVPLMAAILERDEVTADDIARSHQIAATLRARAVAAVERTWLDSAVARAVAGPQTSPPPGVDDQHGLSSGAGSQLRAVVSAVLAAIARLPGFDPSSLRVTVLPSGAAWSLEVQATGDGPKRRARAALVPYLAVFRVITDHARLTCANHVVTLQFDYEH